MWNQLEQFCEAHEHTIALFEAISTFAVVVVTLCLSFLSSWAGQTKLKCFVGIRKVIHSTLDPNNYPRYLIATIRNERDFPVRIPLSFFNWSVPTRNGGYSVLPLDYSATDPLVGQRSYPVEIPPRSTQTFTLSSYDMFRSSLIDMLNNPTKVHKSLLPLVRAKVLTDDGKLFSVKIEKSVKAVMKSAAGENT